MSARRVRDGENFHIVQSSPSITISSVQKGTLHSRTFDTKDVVEENIPKASSLCIKYSSYLLRTKVYEWNFDSAPKIPLTSADSVTMNLKSTSARCCEGIILISFRIGYSSI